MAARAAPAAIAVRTAVKAAVARRHPTGRAGQVERKSAIGNGVDLRKLEGPMQNTLAQCERDVEQARARLAQDLAILRSPAALNSFTDSLKETAIDAKDSIVDELKAKAAANPTATLAIGAGIAWYFVRNPPIAMGLIGAGLYGLWRTNAIHPVNRDYIQQGRERLYEQASDFGASAVDAASKAGQAVSEKAGDDGRCRKAKRAGMVARRG